MKWIELPEIDKLRVLNEIKTRTGFDLFIIEKDWWVVQTLRLISQMDIAEHLVFKGLCTATHNPFYVQRMLM